ncbi:MAG: CHAT domain-containing protein [Chloracidobacterium sp.]|nr:CHAT domain-containing protein [Chloracidobacterium sp.]MDW8216786.1 CHAT domain-containing protein [Acidobacteriota bacterium]
MASRWLAAVFLLMATVTACRPSQTPSGVLEVWRRLRQWPVTTPHGFRLSGVQTPPDAGATTLDAAKAAEAAAVVTATALDPAQRDHACLWRDLAAGDIRSARRRLLTAVPNADSAWVNDRAAAYAEWALHSGRPESFEAALRSFGEALRDAALSDTARFNRALLFQRLGLSARAETEWRRYLADAPTDAWAATAQRHLADLSRQPPDAVALWTTFDRLAARSESAEMERFLADHLGRLIGDGLSEAAQNFLVSGDEQHLARLRQVADAARRRGEEHWVGDLVESLTAIRLNGRATEWLTAYHVLLQARRLYPIEGKPTAAEPLYAQAHRTFLALGDSASAAEAELGLVYCAVQMPDIELLDRRSSRLLAAAQARRYVRLEGQVLRVRAQLALRQADAPSAVAQCRAALARFQTLADWEEYQRTLLILSDAYERQGRSAAALAALRDLLQTGLQHGTNLRRRSQACAFAARTCAAAGAFELGLVFAEEARVMAEGQAFPAFQLDAETLLAVLGVRLGRRTEAAAALARAEAIFAGVTDPRLRAVLALDFLPTAAWCRMELGEPTAALRLCAAAAKSLRIGRHDAYRPLVDSVRGAAYLALGDDQAAEAALSEGIRRLEGLRQKLAQTPDRQRFFHRHADLYEQMARLHLRRGRTYEALDWFERARARTLLDRRRTQEGTACAVRALQRSLPDNLVVVAYAVDDHGVEGFVLDRRTLRRRTLPITRERLTRMTEALLRCLSDPTDQIAPLRQAGQALEAELLSPLGVVLNEATRLAIVPDGLLHGLPWGALCDERGRWLAERTPFAVCPSVAALVQALKSQAQTEHPRRAPALIVADPNPTSDAETEDLPPLTGARDEIACLSSLLGPSLTLAGEQATKARVLEALQGVRLAHLAVHGTSNGEEPLQATLHLTPTDADDGRLTAAEVYARDFPQLRLVTLSACDAALGAPLRGEGLTGLGQAFLAAGAASVVATLGRVEDRFMRDLVCAFYAALGEGLSPAVALQRAQSAHLTRHPAQWALVVVMGAP